MKLEFDLISIIILLGASQGILLALSVLFFKTKDRNQARSHKLLTVFLLTVSACLSSSLFYRTFLFQYVPHISLITDPFRMLLGPILYLYVRELTILDSSFKRQQMAHLLPFLLYFMILLPFYLKSGDYKIDYVWSHLLNSEGNRFDLHKFLWGVTSLHFAGYVVFTHRLIRQHNYRLKDVYSTIEKKIDLTWVNSILIIFLVTFSGFFLFNMVARQIDISLVLDIRIFHIIMTTFLYGLAYKGLNQQYAFHYSPENDQASQSVPEKYETSGITKQESAAYYERLVSFVETRKPYFDPDLSLSKLSRAANIPKGYLSQAVNEHSQSNFYQFINQYRIDTARTMLLDENSAELTILDIAYESGFNSKSTFNKAFKQITGLTPSQYRKKHQ